MKTDLREFHLLNKYVILFLTVTLIVLADQLTKVYITATMTLHSSFVIIKGLLNLTYVRNPGAAFGFLANASPWFRTVFFVIVAVLAIGLIICYIWESRDDEPGLVFALSLILGGASGNLIDRLRFGEVVDFIDFYISAYHWPAFNVADSAISIGAIILIIQVSKRKKID